MKHNSFSILHSPTQNPIAMMIFSLIGMDAILALGDMDVTVSMFSWSFYIVKTPIRKNDVDVIFS